MSRILTTMMVVATALVAVACGEAEEEIALDKVPAHVLEAAQSAVPGITLSEAEVESTDSGDVYDIEGTLDGKEYEIEVSADGVVLEVEEEDEDDDEDEEDESSRQ